MCIDTDTVRLICPTIALTYLAGRTPLWIKGFAAGCGFTFFLFFFRIHHVLLYKMLVHRGENPQRALLPNIR